MLVAGLARLVPRLRQPHHGLGEVAGRECEQPEVVLRDRRGAEVADRREALDRLAVELARPVELVAEEGEVAEVHERRRGRARVVDRPTRLEPGLEHRLRVLEIALLAREDPDRVQGVRARGRRLLGGRRERLLERVAALCQMAMELPEVPERHGEP